MSIPLGVAIPFLGQRERRPEAPTRRRRREEQRLQFLMQTWKDYCIGWDYWVSQLPEPLAQAAFINNGEGLTDAERQRIDEMAEWFAYNLRSVRRKIHEINRRVTFNVIDCTASLPGEEPVPEPPVEEIPTRPPASTVLVQERTGWFPEVLTPTIPSGVVPGPALPTRTRPTELPPRIPIGRRTVLP